jgi:PAS domain S-box-containing protein
MSIRAKIILVTIAFMAMAAILGAGALYILHHLGENLDTVFHKVQLDKYHDKLTLSIRELVTAAEGWADTADETYKEKFRSAAQSVDDSFGEFSALVDEPERTAPLAADLEEMKNLAGRVISIPKPVGDLKADMLTSMLVIKGDSVISRLTDVHSYSLDATLAMIRRGERTKRAMTWNLVFLVAFAFAVSVLLALQLRRVLKGPYQELLAATARVTSGDLDYRLRPGRKDEFEVIAERFNAMVESLKQSTANLNRKLSETELFLSVAKTASMEPEMRRVLQQMADTIAAKMNVDMCAIFLYRVERNGFSLEACNLPDGKDNGMLAFDSETAQRVMKEPHPFLIEDMDRYPEMREVCAGMGSVLVIPLVRDTTCFGIFMLGRRPPGTLGLDEMDTAMILAHSVGTAIRNVELYGETKKQVNQLRIVYELSKALTSLYDPDEILATITSRIAKLINSRGCIIRLIEDGKLKIRSFYGSMDEAVRYGEIPLGRGIAGWVAKEGKPLFVEDITKMPEDMSVPTAAKMSAISVPLKKDENIIGTLGLYDKLDENGKGIPFSLDDLAVAEGFASISAIAIEKVRMQEREKKVEAQIVEAKRRMELLFESVQSGIITLDRNYTITAANRYIERWIDKPLKEIILRNALDVFHEKGGICPHCAARITFEEGDINTITQSSGLNYADLASYPIKDDKGEVAEAVVFIQDITDRVLYQEEIMGLYKEVMQTKEYMESLIGNSADAIVTFDNEGVVKSWNPAAEEIYGFKKDEVVGQFLPFVPESLVEFEKENIERIRRGEVLKMETFRRRKDGVLIEVSLTLSPIKDVTGEIIGISSISRDISDKKRVEKELIRRNQELSRLFFISSAMTGTLELDKLLKMVLTAVTVSDGLGFNRAILFLVDQGQGVLRATMGVGPSSPEEAWRVWDTLSSDHRTLHEMMQDIVEGPLLRDSFLDRLDADVAMPLGGDTVLARCVRERRPVNVHEARREPEAHAPLTELLGTEAYAAVPLMYRGTVIGVLWVDNYFNKKPITEEDMKFLTGFADQVAAAIQAARLFQQVSLAEAELENIFRSISDMVFFTSKDYTVKSVNDAVAERLGMSKESIVGKKCYQVFHGMEEPWPLCSHHKTIETLKHYVEELEDPNLGGTFLTSTSPIFDTDGNFLGTVHIVRDITEIKDLREKLQSKERMAALGEVAAKVAHEIRNPLVSVGGFAKRLENKLDGGLKEYARIISNEVTRLEDILREILGFVREVRVSKREVDLNDVVTGVLDLLGSEVSARGNALVRQLEPEVMINVDPDRMKEAILNIMNNANQATEKGTVTVRTYAADGSGVLEVTDTGCGIREEDLVRIFDPFFTTRPTGTGLGLAISKRIIEENNGRIEARSGGIGTGTVFKIYLPLKEEAHE